MISVWIDGLCQPKNPGGVGTWGVLVSVGVTGQTFQLSGVVGEGEGMTNNVAEYEALLQALDFVHRYRHMDDIIIYSDSTLLVSQMNGEAKAVRGFYLKKYLRAKNIVRDFPHIKFSWIPREQNDDADRLTNGAYERYCEERGRTPIYRRRQG
jgi:ribonuclease HI